MKNFKWEIEIGKKPKGLWRPQMTIKIYTTLQRNELNIDPSYEFSAYFYDEEDFEYCIEECTQTCIVKDSIYKNNKEFLHAPLIFYRNSNTRDDERFRECGVASYLKLPAIENIFKYDYIVIFYPEWRPGKSDYSDYVEWLAKNVLNPCIAEFERRWAEAMESEETETVKFTSDHYSFQKATETQQKSAVTRKVRV